MTAVTVNCTPTKVTVDNQQNVQIVTLGTQGPPGPPGPAGSGGAVRLVTADTTLTANDYNIIADTTDGDIAVQLPTAASLYDSGTNVGMQFVVTKPIAANKLSLLTQVGDTILGTDQLDLDGQGAIAFQAYGPGNEFIIV